ncbi:MULTISPECIES: ZmpA/ZmpB/ZmpC family metallo-endopeptidase [Streptococcus]|uniref:ZmpA/ZmpB/ZmpC family metallo-endopeptidase n=1 Tax=Streptococcus sp. UMB0029 TaxID=2069308 RepID=UPI000C802CE1|nr:MULTISPECIES: ZmpA/ZmpB/ZmpC family metallo-endopeptidase [Streptococcus]MDK7321823.1 ZmpA/ZmpB/ZmpC family metallo-endopeptidase [Streptococcus mitis]PMC01547.1 peptidase M26 [Streptococcus sp. UMB0029]
MSLLKKDKFSIRKIKGIVGSVFLGSLLFAPSIVGASTYHYLDYSNLTQTERDQLKQGRPDESKESYALVYEKDALPNTGQSQSIITVFGLLTIGSLVVVITKDKRNKKIATFLIVGATGLVTLSTTSALNLNANIHESGRDGVLQIYGYRYVGYLELDERTVSPVEQPKVVAEKGEPEVQPELPAAVVSEKVEPAVQPALSEAVVTDKGEPAVQPALPEAVVTDKGEPTVHPELPAAVVSEKLEPAVQPALSEAVVTDKGEPAVQAELPAAVVTEKGKPEVQPSLSEAVVTDKGEPAVQSALPEAVVTEKGEPAVQSALPEAVVTDKGEPAVQPALPEAVVTGKGEPEVQPSLSEAVVTDKGEPAVQPALPEAVVTEKGEPAVQPALPEAVVTEKGESEVQAELPAAVVTEKGEPEVQQELPEAVVTDKGEPEVQAELPAAVVTEKGEPEVQPSLSEAVVTEKGEPEVQAELPAAVVTEKGEPAVQPVLPEYTTKVAPTLTLDKVTEDAMARSAKLDYTLENTGNAEIKSIIAEIKDGDTVVKRVDLSKEKLTDAIQDLDLFKDYKIATTMIYDRGQGAETSKLDEKPLRLELKKVEIKNIASTNLVKVNDDGTETPSDFMTEKPSDEDVKKMYLKITSRDNKVTRLAVDKIELVTEKEKELYKITATAQDLIQHVDPSKTRNEYIHYIEKPRPKDDNVYYNFKDLVDAMNADKNGTFKLGADLNATNVPTPFKQYVPGTFKGHLSSVDGKQYTIHNIARPLFDRVENGSVKNINLGNVDINMPWADGIAPVANMVKNATVEDIKVTGSVIANNNIAGIVNKLDRGANMRNVAFIGKLHAGGDKGQNLAGIVGEIWKGNLDKAFVNATITGKRAKAAGIVSVSGNGMDNYTVGREGSVRHSVAKGTIDIENPVDVGGFISTNWVLGAIEDNVSMMKVSKGEIFFGSHNIDDEDGYFSGNRLNRDYVVKDVSTGLSSYQRSKRISTISQVEADKKIESYGISADKYEIHDPIVNTLNLLTRKEDEYKSTQDYKVDRDLAYRNIEKLQPFYNKEWIVNQGNKLAEDSNLAKKEVLSVTGMKDGQFVTDLSDIDHVMIHYADKTKEIKAVHQKESKVAQVREYSIDGLGDIVYTPNMVDKNRDQLIQDIKGRLATVELISPEVRALMGNRDRAEENTEERKNGYIRDLYLEESFAETKANLDKLVKSLIENADHQLNSDEAAMKALVKKVDENKAKIMMALTYLNRYYDIKYGDMTIKNLMMFKPDFYGKSVDLLDFLIRIGSSERNIKGDRTLDAYRDMIGGTIGKSELHGFLDYNMRLFTNDTDLNDWFIHAAKNVYVVEPKTTNPDFVNKRHRAFDGLNNGVHNRMILPLLTLKNAHIFLISTYNTMAYSSFEKYGKLTEESRNEFKKEIDKVAKGQQTYLDFWSRLALPNVRDRLLKSQNMVPTPVWDNQTYNGSPVGRRGFDSKGNPVAPIRELYGPTWRHHDRDWRMGAMASIFPNPNNDDKVLFMVTDMISQFGISAFTHETTHVNDRMLYFGGNSHREGTDVEAYAQGMLQTPDKSTGNGEYGALGLNMAYHRENDGDQWYNYNPDKLQTREDIDRYMKNYNEALMMLDHLEADAVLESGVSDINTKWFKKVDKAIRTIDNLNKLKAPNQWDKVRDLNEEEKAKKLSSINDLIDNNFMTKHGNPGNGIYRPEDFTPNSAYVNVNMMAGIYGGNTSDGAPGSLSFKHNAFRMWGYYGYENGFISYVSNKYKAEADKNNHGLLSDKLIINKVSQGNFKTLEEWKRHWYGEILVKAKKGFEAIDIDGTHISNYDELRTLFDKAVRKDLEGMSDPKIKDHFKNTVDLKSKVFKALLKNTDGFFNPLFK